MTHTQSNRRAQLLLGAGLALLLANGGCTSLPWQMAPEDRSPGQPTQAATSASQPAPRVPASTTRPLAPVKEGYYRVKPGDTLYRIATAHGQHSDDIARWNSLSDANHIEPGGVLRVAPPDAAEDSKSVATTPAQATSRSPAKREAGADRNDSDKGDKDKSDKTRFGWPARGTLNAVYGQGKSKGMVIAAKAGDPVKAAAAGRVVFAGDGGKPYGKLIVIKHDDTLVTAYGHNRKLLVKEGTTVKRGETIAEMAESEKRPGSEAASETGSLRFEVRKNGKPVDPAPYLPRVGS
ncbi:peptidoglycan DD-metalloendopeptidase family protein [Paraburkholderia sp. CNPSo 3157]|uniref:Peptidoglycan DD-metalloendopeptidase family protein n=1 Tax=Paraburkholderia franconis TaxID=2654983 RepID=A0A7X1TEY7_9BURK|nr:M23 family metallopeptidase [Paraburkholderia franconis]MPW16691.1 peptidoglycan DD-metalloendopeptidase family protein [Paraburkholderia franconis]